MRNTIEEKAVFFQKSRNENSSVRIDRWLVLSFFFLSACFFILLVRLTDGDFFNSYPFISDDGFDWIMQGKYLVNVIQGVSVEKLYVLRDPIFVIVTAVDAIFGSKGYIILASFALSLFFLFFYIHKTLILLDVGPIQKICAIVISLITPLSYFRLFVLADAVCITLMHISLYYMIRYGFRLDYKWRDMLLSGFFGLLAMLTQLYGGIPFLLGMMFFVGHQIILRRRMEWRLITFFAGWLLCYGLLIFCWYRVVDHSRLAGHFEFLRMSLEMKGFYSNVWFYHFFFAIPILCTILFFLPKRFRHLIVWPSNFLLLCVFVFATLTFFYQWKEARFTYYYFYIFVIALCSLVVNVRRIRSRSAGLLNGSFIIGMTLIILTGFFIVPQNPWEPKIDDLSLAPKKSWVLNLITSKPLNRFSLDRENYDQSIWLNAKIPKDLSPYKDDTFKRYFALKNISSKPK